MSVINRMLRDLDRRHALPDSASADASVRVVPQAKRSDAFWITLGVAALAGVGWLSWVVYQLQQQPLATPLALSRPAVPPPVATPAPALSTPTPVSPAPAPASGTPELFRLAESIDTPVAPAPARKQLPKPAKLPSDQAIGLPAVAAKSPGQLSKHDRPFSSSEEAELLFQKGVDRLNQGRASAAAQEFASALQVEPTHEAARQALIAVRLEQSELDAAEQLLNEGTTLSPSNAQFATVLARIRVERGDYDGALSVLERARDAGASDAELQLLLATVLQRLGRDKEAVVAFENSVRLAEPSPAAWIAMGMSYENIGSKAQALGAYRHSIGAGANPTLRGYAENRIRALK